MMSIECPHCGNDLAEGGVVELVGYLQYPNDEGKIPYDNRLSRPLDDTEGYRCAHCGEDLNFDDSDGMIRIFGR